MCGIVGIYLKTKKYEKQLGKFLSGMLDGMAIPSNIPDKNLPSCFSYFFVLRYIPTIPHIKLFY